MREKIHHFSHYLNIFVLRERPRLKHVPDIRMGEGQGGDFSSNCKWRARTLFSKSKIEVISFFLNTRGSDLF